MKIIYAISLVCLSTAATTSDGYDAGSPFENMGSAAKLDNGMSNVPTVVPVASRSQQRMRSNGDESTGTRRGESAKQKDDHYLRARGAYFNPQTGRFIPGY